MSLATAAHMLSEHWGRSGRMAAEQEQEQEQGQEEALAGPAAEEQASAHGSTGRLRGAAGGFVAAFGKEAEMFVVWVE